MNLTLGAPAGFEGFFRRFADFNDAGPIDPAAVAELAVEFGLPYADPEWPPDVIARYNLKPPPPRVTPVRCGAALTALRCTAGMPYVVSRP